MKIECTKCSKIVDVDLTYDFANYKYICIHCLHELIIQKDILMDLDFTGNEISKGTLDRI